MKSILEAGDLKGKYVIVRSSLNIPLNDDGSLRNEYRLLRALPTLRYLHEVGARTIVLAHIGREPEETLKPVYEAMKKYLPAQWGGAIGSQECYDRRALMADGDVLLLENTRKNAGEAENDAAYAKVMAGLGDVFVNDAFAAAHRAHASTVGVAQFLPSFAGLTLLEEVQKLSAVTYPEHPALFLLGGAKFETKMPLIEKYIESYDHVFVAGALINDVLKAKGYEVGQSLLSDTSLAGAPFLESEKLLLPVDVVVHGPNGDRVCGIGDVQPEESMLDVGPETVAMLTPYIKEAKTILWNGPFGHYEGGYTTGTEDTAKVVSESTANSVLGGGDTVAAVEKLGLNEKFGHVSIGGGAMLEFLENGTLPVIDVLNN